jgi:SPP1 gp7 family putative phage head morphogenesis protein
MPSNDYWRERELDHIRFMIQNDQSAAERLRQIHNNALQSIQDQIDAFYGRYADRTGISMEEARKRVSRHDVEAFSSKAAQYVKEKNFTPRANEELRLYNVTMKINRLELLKKQIELELIAARSAEELFLFQRFTAGARAEYERQAGILGMSVDIDAKALERLVNADFLGAKWSDRIWADQQALKADIDKLLARGILQGTNPKVLARELRKTFDTSIYNSERLLRTEMSRVQADAFTDSMDQAGIAQYEYVAEPSACDICDGLNGKRFDVKDAQPGTNIYPMHPNCKCSTIPYVDREAFEADLRARGL